ncbi:hypothetical protein AGMMS49940_10460 [Spirochaetia bacterium]|nr:hypothetical protein AGMMS49940_10460 [Spirochaetia bacterium]
MLLTFQGYFNKGEFISDQKMAIPERKKAIVTILDEDINQGQTIKEKMSALQNINKLIDTANDEEELPDLLKQSCAERLANMESLFGILPNTITDKEIKEERLKRYEFDA